MPMKLGSGFTKSAPLQDSRNSSGSTFLRLSSLSPIKPSPRRQTIHHRIPAAATETMMQLPTRHIITGGAGFIGSHLTETLLERGDRVVVLDNLQHAQRDWLEQVRIHPRLEICQGDLLHPEELRGLLTASDLVWHLAANTNMVIGAQNPQVDVENGFLATQRLLEWMRSEGTHKLVFASSGAVYGDMARPPASEQYGPLLPVSMYGATKLAGEALLSAYHHVFGMQAWIFRFGNVLGARMS